jgi:hypothetical protein
MRMRQALIASSAWGLGILGGAANDLDHEAGVQLHERGLALPVGMDVCQPHDIRRQRGDAFHAHAFLPCLEATEPAAVAATEAAELLLGRGNAVLLGKGKYIRVAEPGPWSDSWYLHALFSAGHFFW